VNNEFTRLALPLTKGAVPITVASSVKVTLPPLGAADVDAGALTWAVNVTGWPAVADEVERPSAVNVGKAVRSARGSRASRPKRRPRNWAPWGATGRRDFRLGKPRYCESPMVRASPCQGPQRAPDARM
jgi:hypothetical protein